MNLRHLLHWFTTQPKTTNVAVEERLRDTEECHRYLASALMTLDEQLQVREERIMERIHALEQGRQHRYEGPMLTIYAESEDAAIRRLWSLSLERR